MGLPFKSQEETMKPPLLFLLGELSDETKHALLDPIRETFNAVTYPELEGQTECLSSGHGWILLLSRETSSLFFFNPLTHQRLDIPYRNSIFSAVAFSAPPTSPDCTVFVMETPAFNNGRSIIDTFCIAQEEKRWIRHAYDLTGSRKFSNVVQVICANRVLYCIDSHGRIATFDIENGSWILIRSKKVFKSFFYAHFVEYNGDIFAGKKGKSGVLEKVYKLKLKDGVADWEEVKDMGGVTLFFGAYGGCAMLSSSLAAEGLMENKVVFARDKPQSKCEIYEFDEHEWNADTGFDATPYGWCYTPVWIDHASN